MRTITHQDAGAISRPRLLRLLRNDAYRVVSMVAPGGYGKTTLMRALSSSERRTIHYVQPTELREDGGDLLFLVRRALDTAEPYTLVVDGVGAPSPHLLTSLFLHTHSAPPGSRLIVSSRRPVDWATALDIKKSAVRQVGPGELAFTPTEASDVLLASGVRVDDEIADRLFDCTRGWPIAHYLCARLQRCPEMGPVMDQFGGLQEELLRGLVHELLTRAPADTRRFLTRTSVLTTLSGPLCDWLLETSDCDEVLTALAQENLLVVPAHNADGMYRYQRLFGALLRAELNEHQPDVAAAMHLRAGEWFADRGDDLAARWHRQAARAASRSEGPRAGVREGRPSGAPDLSLAEMQVLALLPSHLSFEDIGMRLGRSGHAIQRLAIGIYRELGVISRRDAVERGLVLGLVADDALRFPA